MLRYAPLPGNPVLTEQTFPPQLVLLIGIAASVLLGALLWLLAQVGALYQEVGRLARADRALYAAKEAGRNRVCADAATAAETAAP